MNDTTYEWRITRMQPVIVRADVQYSSSGAQASDRCRPATHADIRHRPLSVVDRRVYVEREVTGVVAMRVLLSVFVVLLLGAASAHAPVYHGNDTGGVNPWSGGDEAAAAHM